MKSTFILLVTFIVIIVKTSAQVTGDYRSIGSGNWNDATKWETYNGSNWVSAATYPGQQPGAGAGTIMVASQINLTATVPYPITYLLISGVLTYSSVSPVTLTVSGSASVYGELRIENQSGAKTHTLTIGGGLEVGQEYFDPYCMCWVTISPGYFQTINQDDKLGVIFNTTSSYNEIRGPNGISFQDITFNGTGITVATPIGINGTAAFVNGIVEFYTYTDPGPYNGPRDIPTYEWDFYYETPYPNSGSIVFHDGATVTGASNASFVDAQVYKEGDDPFIFPIGNGGVYAPLAISAPLSNDLRSAQYIRSSGTTPVGGISDPGLYNVSNCEYWVIFQNSTSNVTVGWNSASGCESSPYITSVSQVTLAYSNGNTWQNHGGTGTGTVTNGSVTWYGVTNSGYFTLGNLNASCIPPSSLTTTNISANSATLTWSAVPGSVSYDVDYRNSGSWTNAATAVTSTSLNLSGLSAGVSHSWRVRSNCSSGSSSYRQADFTTESCGTPYALPTTNITANAATVSWSAIPGALSYSVDYSALPSGVWTNAAAAMTSTSLTLSGLSPGVTYNWRVRANCNSGTSSYWQAQFWTVPCDPPWQLTTYYIGQNSASLNWSAALNAINYNVEYKESTATSWIPAVTGTTSLAYYLTGLLSSTKYDWRVQTVCIGPAGGNYAQSSFITAPCEDGYEPNNTSASAKTIYDGSTISALISSNTDVDWFKITTPNSNNPSLKVALSNLRADYDLYVYNRNLVMVGSSTNTGTANEVVVKNSPGRNTNYYIKVVGKDGAYNALQCYSLSVQVAGSGGSVTRASSDLTNEITDASNGQLLYPNPASEFVHLRFNSNVAGSSNVQILNSVGQLVKQYPVNITNGINELQIPLHDVKSGMYMLKINKDGESMMRKFVVAR